MIDKLRESRARQLGVTFSEATVEAVSFPARNGEMSITGMLSIVLQSGNHTNLNHSKNLKSMDHGRLTILSLSLSLNQDYHLQCLVRQQQRVVRVVMLQILARTVCVVVTLSQMYLYSSKNVVEMLKVTKAHFSSASALAVTLCFDSVCLFVCLF